MNKTLRHTKVTFRYFTITEIKNRILSVLEMPSDTAVDMVNPTVNCLRENGLDPSKMISVTADNTNTNFGGRKRNGDKNVYAILTRG